MYDLPRLIMWLCPNVRPIRPAKQVLVYQDPTVLYSLAITNPIHSFERSVKKISIRSNHRGVVDASHLPVLRGASYRYR